MVGMLSFSKKDGVFKHSEARGFGAGSEASR